MNLKLEQEKEDKKLRDEVESVGYEVSKSNIDNEYTFSLIKNNKKKYILNKFGPREQAIKLIGNDLKNYETIWILVGYNFGYGVDYLRKKINDKIRIIVIEPNKDILQEQKKYTSYYFDDDKNVYFFSGYNFKSLRAIVSAWATNINFNNIQIKADEYYLKLYPQYLKQVATTINDYISHVIINFNTISSFRLLWIKNAILNRDKIQDCYDLSYLQDKYMDIPAVIVSAGPSLKKNIDLLKEFKGIILCMGRTLDALMDRGIRPDFVCCVDPSDLIYETFGKHKEYDIPLINLAYGNPKVTHGAKKEVYLMSNSGTVMNILNLRVNPGLSCSGSVATLCCSVASYMGCTPIIFLGQDLAFTNNEKHSTLTLIDKEDNKKEKVKKAKYTKGFYGDMVETDESFNGFREWFEEFIELNPQKIFINATEGGAYINGAKHMSFRECLDKYCNKIIKRPVIEHKKLYENVQIDPDGAIDGALYALKKINHLTRKGKGYYKQLITANNEVYKAKLQKEIATIDKKILRLDRGEKLIEVLMDDIAYAISGCNDSKEPVNETKIERNKRIYRLQAEVYECLEQESKKVIKVIENALKEENEAKEKEIKKEFV